MPSNQPIQSTKNGNPITYTNLSKACKDLGLKRDTVYKWFANNKDKTTYTSKSGITLQKVELK